MALQSSDAPPVHDVAATSAAAGEAHVAGTAAAHGGEHGSGGLPQFEFQWWPGQIFWLLIIFGVLYVLLSKIFLPRLRGVRDERASTIAAAVDAARQVQTEAAGHAEAAKREVEDARASARTTATAAKARVTEQANARAAAEEAVVNARIADAEAAIAKTRDKAMGNVADIASDTAKAIVEKLTGQAPAAAEVSSAVKGAA